MTRLQTCKQLQRGNREITGYQIKRQLKLKQYLDLDHYQAQEGSGHTQATLRLLVFRMNIEPNTERIA